MTDPIYYYQRLIAHKFWLFLYMSQVSCKLFFRAIMHDMSKFHMREAKEMSKLSHKLSESVFDSQEYRDCLSVLDSTIQLHYAHNQHHPEHYGDYKKMDMLHLIEMACDWKASARKHKNGDFKKNFEICKKRFGIDDRTAELLKSLFE